MPDKRDVIVIGSGFGGAITACRLAERGLSVLVLERGRRWRVDEYPRTARDAWIFDVDCPEEHNGWMDLRIFPEMVIASGAGVGGGSLIYANVFIEAPPEIFEAGWPAEITYDELTSHYATVGRMLNVQEIPDGQLTRRFEVVREGAEKLGYGDRFRKVPLAVAFDPEWSYQLERPFSQAHSKPWINEQGQEQGTCVHLGRCDIGCDVRAKNTLDLNYIPLAERHGAEFRPLHLVRSIEPEDGGYRVRFDRIRDGALAPGSEWAERVVLAAGSLGSTEILLRCRDQYRTLPGLSRRLGRGWSSNGDFLTPAFHDRPIHPTQGPTISSAIDFLDGAVDGQRFFIEDGGWPALLGNWLAAKAHAGGAKRIDRKIWERLWSLYQGSPPLDNVMPWFAQGIDAADGRLRLGRRWWAPWKRTLKLDWEVGHSEPLFDAIVAMHERLAEITGGRPWVPPHWGILKDLGTPHPLGGCNIGNTAADGVVDHRGEVFGYPNLFVVDGAIVPEAIGRNPSRTIAALAERSAALMEV